MKIVRVGDLVRVIDAKYEMIVIGQDDDALDQGEAVWFCAWEIGNQLHEQAFAESRLVVVRKERRRIPRGGVVQFPVHPVAAP